MDYNWIRGYPRFRDYLCKASETRGEKLLLNQKSFPETFLFLSQLNQLLQAAFFFFFLLINQKYVLNFVKAQRRATFHGGSLIAWIAGCGWASRAVAILSTSDTNIHVRYMCSPLWWAVIWRWTTCSLQWPYLGIWPAIFAPVPTYELQQPSPLFHFTEQIRRIQNDHISRAAVYLQPGLCKYTVALFLLPPPGPRPQII